MYTFFQGLIQGLMNGITSIANWFGSIFYNIFNALKSFFTFLLEPVILLFEGIWYLITSIFSIVVLVVKLILGIFHVVFAIIGGIFTTFGQLLGFTGTTSYYSLPSAYEPGFTSVLSILNQTGFNTIAYIFVVFVWMATAYAVINIAGGDN
ncbi:MAG: hypothetical protein M0P20_07090 [Methanocorpusculum sp.]|nr:hypothetical protein [Methanocorpusculum sp.]